MNGYEIFGVIMGVSILGVLVWGFKPMYDSTKRDIERHNKKHNKTEVDNIS